MKGFVRPVDWRRTSAFNARYATAERLKEQTNGSVASSRSAGAIGRDVAIALAQGCAANALRINDLPLRERAPS